MLCEESGRRRQCRGPRGESGVNSIGLPSVRVCNQANPITSAYTPPPYNHRRSVPRSELSRARSGQPAGGCRPLVAERVTACALPFFTALSWTPFHCGGLLRIPSRVSPWARAANRRRFFLRELRAGRFSTRVEWVGIGWNLRDGSSFFVLSFSVLRFWGLIEFGIKRAS